MTTAKTAPATTVAKPAKKEAAPKPITAVTVAELEKLVENTEGVKIIVRAPETKKIKLPETGAVYHGKKPAKPIASQKALAKRLEPYLGDIKYVVVDAKPSTAV